ncbi:hypothetical protein MTR67_037827 [Solanum verrucosum]|uniref:Uncharacterized protein n=1 Tax=Solanum verrucosum TaxID=315347 RepID=A0AAF0UEE2_SOLVR|nr:hypothetical protein MTR67_037827 [Solanum verrucosum]
MNGKGWRPWRSERRGAPALKLQRSLLGALRDVPRQGGNFRTPVGARLLARRPSLFPKKSDSSPLFFQL